MRLLHTSDLHLGKRLHGHSLLPDQIQALEQVTRLAQDHQADVLVVAGDVFDRTFPPEEAVTAFGDWLRALRRSRPDMPVVIIAGNHDSAQRLSWPAGLLADANVFVRGRPDSVVTPISVTTAAGEQAQIWALPFAWAGDLPPAEGEQRSQVSAFETGVRWVTERQDTEKAQVLVAHCFARGGAASDSERTLVGQATLIDPAVFDGFDYVALGHLHRPQRVSSQAYYSGSPLAYSFSENSDHKSIALVECGRGRAPSVTRLPVRPLRPVRTVTATLEALLDSSEYDHLQESYLMAELSQPSPLPDPMGKLRARFPHILHLRVPRSETLDNSRAVERDEAPDLESDLRSFWRHVDDGDPGDEVMAAFATLNRALQRRGGER